MSKVATDTSPDGVYSKLRTQALTLRRGDVGIPPPPSDEPIWGLVMETTYPVASATLVTLLDGTTSLYFSNGGGVIGGHAHETVRLATASFLAVANRVKELLGPATDNDIPAPGHTIFYALTDDALLTTDALEEDLGQGKHDLSELFFAGHAVISELRLLHEAAEKQAGPPEQ